LPGVDASDARELPVAAPVPASGKLRILVVSRSYPSPGDLYRYPFVHRRVRAYEAAGQEVAVFRPAVGESAGRHWFDGVECVSGDASALEQLAGRFRPDVLAVHGLGPVMWPVVRGLAGSLPMAVWLHGSEISGFLQRKSSLDGKAAEAASASVKACCDFWCSVLGEKSTRRQLVFPSRTAVEYAEEGLPLDAAEYAVVPNPIDTELFGYAPKAAEQRFHVLLIRPFDSRAYGNDLAVAAILALQATSPEFERMRFTIHGDGPLFDDTLEPLLGLSNVSIRRGFLTQEDIAAEHKSNGIFLVPTRLDTHGVSRDEAMSSGLVPVTNAIPPINEFVDDSCAAIAEADNPQALATALACLVCDPEGFVSKSDAAARRIRAARNSERIIPQELSLLHELLHG
jgi:glycosyltransferase involved in cell wall biosynthesis